jgi:hypothetical protein
MKKLLLILLTASLMSCEKESIEPQAPLTKVQYVIETEHGYTWYNIESTEYSKSVFIEFDTTFYTEPGWECKIQALTHSSSMRVSLLVNDKIIASEQTYTGQQITIIRDIY